MAIIVVGKLALKPGTRAEYVLRSIVSVALARKDVTCLDFAVSPDPIDSDRVNVYEKWKSRADLESFRSAGSSDDLFSLVESFDVSEYEVPEIKV